jgi:hypothetical protein
LAGAHAFVDVADDFEGGFGAVFVDFAGLDRFEIGFARVAQDVECVFAGEGAEFAALGPVDALGFDFDSAN